MDNKTKLYSMMQDGFAAKQAARVSSGGDWRGGNSGCMLEDGTVIGSSPQDTVLRHLGIEIPTTLDDDLIFEAGFTNENHWAELLELAGVSFKCEEEIPVVWSLPNGETVTGRPDMVVGVDRPAGFHPEFVVEHKLVSSNGKMQKHSHFGAANPSAGHVCQVGHYSHQLGIPGVLAYTSRAHYTAFYWGAAAFPLRHRSMMTDDKTGKVVSVAPFISLYNITWVDDVLCIDDKPTTITSAGIERFYQYCSDCVRDNVVPIRGGGFDVWGGKDAKDSIIRYNDFAAASTSDWDTWLRDCQMIADGSL